MIVDLLKNFFAKVKDLLHKLFEGDFIMCAISSVLYVYTLIMAAVSSITYDEGYTYFSYARRWAPDFFATDYANNHPLNTVLIYISAFFFPYNELAIRLPNLIFLILYLIVSVKIAKKIPKFKLIVFGLLVLYWMLIPEYFSLARGYGISSALVLLFLYYFKEKDNNYDGIIRNFYILLLASYAYTGLLPVVAALAVYYVFFEIKFNLLAFLKKQYRHLIFLFVNYAYIAYFLISVSSEGKPIYGSKQPFVESVTAYYLKSFSKLFPSLDKSWLFLLSIAFFLVGVITILYRRKKAKITFVILLSLLLFYGASKLSGKPYITGRLLLPIYPLIVLSFIEILDFFTAKIKSELFYRVLNPLLLTLLLYNYVVTSDLVIINSKEEDYKTSVYKNINFHVKPPRGHNFWGSIEFYKRKLKAYPPLDEIKKINKDFHFKVPGKIELFYLQKKSLLFLIAGPDIDVKDRFYLHIAPLDKKNIQKGREKWDFNNFDFNWKRDSDKYMYIPLPKYKLAYIRIGQKGWSKKFIIKN